MNKETRVSPQMTACSNCWTIGPLARTRRAELPIQERCHVIRQALTDEPPVHRRLGRRTTLAAGQQRHQHEVRQQRQDDQAHIFERLDDLRDGQAQAHRQHAGDDEQQPEDQNRGSTWPDEPG